ncbi:MAG: M24 family metallopeptidase [Anaerolineae bacterium]|nr:M24 family metallopeptidase [Anaerolineae bacterium]
MTIESYPGRVGRSELAYTRHWKILPLRDRIAIWNTWLQRRLDTLLPGLMARAGVDLWIVTAEEHNEDPVLLTLIPQPAFSARRRALLVFYRGNDDVVERLTVDRYGYGDLYKQAWNSAEETQFECLARIVRERNPATIGLNVSPTFAFGDGLSHSSHARLVTALDDRFRERVCSAERLAVGWLERRLPEELTVYPGIVELGHAIIAAGLSSRVIHPGITTTGDVVWWFRQALHDLGVTAWFQPTVDLQAPGMPPAPHGGGRTLILPGDLIHCDVGFRYLGLCTDQQQLAYVLKPGESDAPQGLKKALADGNRMQDSVTTTLAPGKTGNQVLREALEQGRAAGLNPTIYCHPIGYHGHAAGPTIGLWDQQDGVPGKGDYPLYNDTCYAIELNVKVPTPEWGGQDVQIGLEEDALLADGQIHWLHGRQTDLHLIG